LASGHGKSYTLLHFITVPTTHLILIILNGLAPLLLWCLVFVIVLKGIWRSFPVFTAYTVFHAISIPLTFFVQYRPHATYLSFFYTYWLREAIAAVLAFCVISEIYSHIFARYEALEKLGKLLFRWVGSIIILVAVVTAASTSGSDFTRLVSGILALSQAIAIIKTGLVLFLFMFAVYFHLRWPNYLFGITVGLGFYASLDLFQKALLLRHGLGINMAAGIVNSAAYNCSVIIWLTYLLVPMKENVSGEEFPASDLDHWNQALVRVLER
jgi:hypothetical protein